MGTLAQAQSVCAPIIIPTIKVIMMISNRTVIPKIRISI